jgi:hypothetical protein
VPQRLKSAALRSRAVSNLSVLRNLQRALDDLKHMRAFPACMRDKTELKSRL